MVRQFIALVAMSLSNGIIHRLLYSELFHLFDKSSLIHVNAFYNSSNPTESDKVVGDSSRNIPQFCDDIDEVEDLPSSLEEMKKEYDLKNKAREGVSQLIGDKLLRGWTLTEWSCEKAACRGCPLMRAPGDDALLCLSCGIDVGKAGSGNEPKQRVDPSPPQSIPERSILHLIHLHLSLLPFGFLTEFRRQNERGRWSYHLLSPKPMATA